MEDAKEQPQLSIIIVSYNTSDVIGTCLESVFLRSGISREVFVVDNASTDGSVDFVKTHFPRVTVLPNTRNVGFAGANNQILPLCRGRYILFLNPDAWLHVNAVENMIAYMDDNPHIGLAGCNIVYPNGEVQWSVSYRYPGQRCTSGELNGLPGSIASVLGAVMIARSKLIKDLGGFDESFFLYGEDQDLCLRIRKSGYSIGYTDSATVTHLGGSSEKSSDPSAVWEKKIKAEYIFYNKHYLPETIRKISRAYVMKCYWRIATLKILYPFAMDKVVSKNKMKKYQVILKQVKHDSNCYSGKSGC
jgi:hypothetical protein